MRDTRENTARRGESGRRIINEDLLGAINKKGLKEEKSWKGQTIKTKLDKKEVMINRIESFGKIESDKGS